MGEGWEGNSAGSGLGLRAHILWEGLARGLVSVAVLGTTGVTVLYGQRWSTSSQGEGGPEARRRGQSCRIQDQEASGERRPPSSSISSRRRRPAS